MSAELGQNTQSQGPNFNKIRVVVRVRPYLEEELKNEEQAVNPSIKIRDSSHEIE